MQRRAFLPAISADLIDLDECRQPHLRSSPPLVPFKSRRADSFTAPPELQLRCNVELPEELNKARKILADAGATMDPRRIDIFFLGSLLGADAYGCFC